MLAKVLEVQGLANEAIDILENVQPPVRDSFEITFERARLLYRVKGPQAALELLESMVVNYPEDADLLAFHADFASMEGVDTRAEMVRSMQEIQRAQELAPNDPKVKEIAQSVYFTFQEGIVQLENGGYDYLWLTSTPDLPTPWPTLPEPTLAPPTATTPAPITETTVPAQEATSTPVPVTPAPSSASNPLCGSAFLVPLGLVWLVRRKSMLRS